eukprot:GSChrysophyteH1.ASY1.ANO1.873.1 assembled CDS
MPPVTRPPRITSTDVEHKVKLQRVLDVQRSQLANFSAESNKLLAEARAQAKIEIKRRQADQQSCKTEMEYERKMKEELKAARIKERTMQQNQMLASEMDKEMAEEQRRKREIQRICDESPELKELEKALKIAYMNKERAAQFEEKVLLAQREQERIQTIEDQMEYDRQKALLDEESKKGAKNAMFDDQRKVLQKQIRDRQNLLEEARLQTLKDREMVDEIVQKINDEDRAEASERRAKQRATAEMVRNYQLQFEEEKRQAKLKAEAEERAIEAYQKAVSERGAGVEAKKQAKKAEEDRILAKIVEETERKRKEEEEFNDLRDMLWAEELEASRARDAQARKDKSTRARQEMMEANERMLQAKAEQRIREAENEARMIARMKEKFAADEERERNEENQKKAIKAHHMDLIAQQANQRRAMYEEEKVEEVRANEEAQRREAYRKMVIQEARKRLIEEHSQKLQGFMPRGKF